MRRRRRCGCGGPGLPNKADLALECGGEALSKLLEQCGAGGRW